jgi:hypothetical protein
MVNMYHQNHSPSRPLRYTIKELLEITHKAHSPFDLSKFSYDAARGESTSNEFIDFS